MNKPTAFYVFNNDLIKWTGEDGKLNCLQICQDNDASSPRDDQDNLTVMACFHRRYLLGDNLADKSGDKYEPLTYLRKLVKDTVSGDTLVAAVKAGKCPRLRVSPSDQHFPLYNIFGGEDDELLVENVAAENLASELADIIDCSDDIVGFNGCLSLLSDYMEYLPLWLYDHSGITMSCGARTYPYSDRWDSCQVGWIFAKKETLIKEGVATEENWRKVAKEVMEYDVKVYDDFLTGQVYGYQLYEADQPESPNEEPDWEMTDSCWGFYGDDIMKNGIADDVNIKDIIKNGAYITGTVKEVCTVSYEFKFAS